MPREFSRVATTDDIEACFRLLLNRWPYADEFAGHSIFVGADLEKVVATYLQSLEFKQRKLTHVAEGKPEMVQMDGFRMYVRPDDLAVGAVIISTGGYEPHVASVFSAHLKEGMTVLDVGANAGLFALMAASRVGARGKVFAVEPCQDNLKLILASMKENGFDNLDVFLCGASDRPGIVALARSFSTASIARLPHGVDVDTDIALVFPLDRLIPADARVDIIKIDIDGAEYLAMKGAAEILRRNRPVVFSELAPRHLKAISGVEPDEYLQMFTSLGYDIHVLPVSGVPATIDCGQSVDRVMQHLDDEAGTHIDVMLVPQGR
jgi:FkbM family methyltransferase